MSGPCLIVWPWNVLSVPRPAYASFPGELVATKLPRDPAKAQAVAETGSGGASVPGRDVRFRAPPGQFRASPIRALGSYLGCLTAKRTRGQGCRTRGGGR